MRTPTVLVSGTSTPGTDMVINGLVVHVNHDGSFSVVLSLLEGENTITATATSAAWRTCCSDSLTVMFVTPVPGLEDRIDSTDADVSALSAQLSSITVELRVLNDELAAASAAGDLTAVQIASVLSEVTALGDLLTGFHGVLSSTSVNVSELSTLLDQTIIDLESTKASLATAQERIDAQSSPSSDGTAYMVLGIVAIALVVIRTKQP